MCVLLSAPSSRTQSMPVFQQVDIENATDPNTGRTMLRMFGVTEVPFVLYNFGITTYYGMP